MASKPERLSAAAATEDTSGTRPRSAVVESDVSALSGTVSVNHTDFPISPAAWIVPHWSESSSTMVSPRPCGSISPGERRVGIPAPASVTST